MSKPTLNLSLVFIIFTNFLIIITKSKPLAPALYAFGDSGIDNGNNNWYPTSAKANYPPYSRDFPGPVALGRFTNAKTSMDFLAEYMGLADPPPYASLFGPNHVGLSDPSNTNVFQTNTFSGYNYASASCGLLRETGYDLGKCNSFEDQVGFFQQTKETKLAQIYKDPTQLSEHLSKSIFFVSIGANDYLNNYFILVSPYNKLYDRFQYAQLLIDVLSQQLKRLYNLGARKIVVTDIGPIGCIPNGAKYDERMLLPKGQCDEDANDILKIFNTKLPLLLGDLSSTLPGSYFVFAQFYSFAYDAITNPTKYGFSDSAHSCCTTVDDKLLCVPGTTTCSNPDKYIFWDGYHPTQAVHSLVAQQLFYGSSYCSPFNISRLVQF